MTTKTTKTKEMKAVSNKQAHVKSALIATLLYIVLGLAALFVLLPFYIMVSTSFKSFGEVFQGFTWVPQEPTFDAYINLFGESPLGLSLPLATLNTLLYVIPTNVVGLLTSTLAAYTFAKYDFRGKKWAFSFLMLTMMVPGAVTLMPQYLIYSNLGWVNTPLPLIIPGMFGAAGTVFFMRQFIYGIPTELIAAGRVDGLSKFGAFFRVILPLCVPALLAQFIIGFIAGWNDYMGPLIYLAQVPERYTLQIMLQSFVEMSGSAIGKNIPAMMAGSTLSVVPLLLIYIFTQKYFLSGIAVSGMKA